MRMFLVGLLLICGNCFADATLSIKDTGRDANDNIVVWTEHKIDGNIVYSSYPQTAVSPRLACPEAQWDSTAKKCKVWATRYSYQNLVSAADTKAKIDYIKADIANYSKQLVRTKYVELSGDPVKVEVKKANDLLETELKDGNIIGATQTVSIAEIRVDTDKNAKADKLLEVKSDGTKTEKELDETTGLVK